MAIKCGNADAVAERFTLHCETEFRTEQRNRAVVFVASWHRQGLRKHGRRIQISAGKGGSNMLNEIINGCFVFMVLVMLGCFAAGASEIASERAERRRVEKLIRDKYPKTF